MSRDTAPQGDLARLLETERRLEDRLRAARAEAADVVAPALVGAIVKDASASVRAAAGHALAELRNVSNATGAAVVQALLQAVPKEQDGEARAAGYRALAGKGLHVRENKEAVVAALTAALQDPDPDVQAAAEKGLRFYKR